VPSVTKLASLKIRRKYKVKVCYTITGLDILLKHVLVKQLFVCGVVTVI